ncbi:MAG: Citrate synthase, partial [Bacteroidetes bacterium]|nr:Citrate synthase [Bacteroidota bacterium]
METKSVEEPKKKNGQGAVLETIKITDSRTGKAFEIPIQNDTIKAIDLRQIKVKDDDFGMMTYDPAFMNTASCKSKITFIDGDLGIAKTQLDEWTNHVRLHTFVHENVRRLMEAFRHDAHPMGIFVSTLAAMSTFYPEAKKVLDPEVRRKQVWRLIGKVPTIAAWAYRHSIGLPYVYPDNDLSYTENFLAMMYKVAELKYKPDPVLAKALEVLFILHADHEQNCSANAMRSVGSSQVDPYCAAAGAAAALYGPLHGGANEAVLRMLDEIG